MKKRAGCLVAIVAIVLIVVLPVSIFFYLLIRPAPVYETNDIADYGIITGNYDNETPKEFVSSFFPERIEEYFSNVSYHYKAIKADTYAYEMYLEFDIEDKDEYTRYLSNVIGDGVCEPFYADPAYQVHYISNYLCVGSSSSSDYSHYFDEAKVGLVLFAEEKQCVIFVAFGVYDGGYANMGNLNFFFNKFRLNLRDYIYQTHAKGHIFR